MILPSWINANLIVLLYCMIMYTVSYCLNRPLDLQGFLVLVAPLLAHNIAGFVRIANRGA